MAVALITGGAGFIGTHLAKRLLAEAFDVIIIDNLSWGRTDRVPEGVQLIRGDIAELGVLQQIDAPVSHVFHLAALISAQESLSNPDAYVRTNVNGTLRLIEQCAAWRGCRLIFASTSGVYAGTPDAIKRETDTPVPRTVYALTKLAGEHLLAIYRQLHGFDDVSLRFFNVYGPGQGTEHPYANVACRFAHAAALGLPVQLYGDGSHTRDFVYIDDVVTAIVAAALRPVTHRILNVGTGIQSSIGEVLDLVQEMAGIKLAVDRRPAWRNDIDAIEADCARSRKALGLAATIDLREGLRRTIDSFRSLQARM
jgi:nucleoside-diphosphate-sugar epimerase